MTTTEAAALPVDGRASVVRIVLLRGDECPRRPRRARERAPRRRQPRLRRRLGVGGQPAPAGEAVMAWHVTIAPSWFDPSTAPAQITPFGILYALHDALVRPLPGQKMGPSLAESWTESSDGLAYAFKLRRGLKFHNGDPGKIG